MLRLNPSKVVLLLTAEDSSTTKLACVASVSSRGSSRKLGQEQKK